MRVTLPRQPCGTLCTWRKTQPRQMMAMVMGAKWRMPRRQGGAVWRPWVRRVSRGRSVRLTAHVPYRVERQMAGGSLRVTTVMPAVSGM